MSGTDKSVPYACSRQTSWPPPHFFLPKWSGDLSSRGKRSACPEQKMLVPSNDFLSTSIFPFLPKLYSSSIISAWSGCQWIIEPENTELLTISIAVSPSLQKAWTQAFLYRGHIKILSCICGMECKSDLQIIALYNYWVVIRSPPFLYRTIAERKSKS